MKTRRFTVLIREEYDPANGVEMTDEEATAELRDVIQATYDDTAYGPGTNFLITDVEDGDKRFWTEWAARLNRNLTRKEQE